MTTRTERATTGTPAHATGGRDTAATTLQGTGVCPGLGFGPVVAMPDPVAEPPHVTLPADASADDAAAGVAVAAARVHEDLLLAASQATGTGAEVLGTTAQMAADPALTAAAQALVRDERLTPERAVWVAAGRLADRLAALGGYLAERARDVADVRDRVVAALTDRPAPGVPDPGHPFVLVAHDLAPADTATLDTSRVRAIVTVAGGPTSHTAILARALGIPAVVGAAGADGLVGRHVVVDGARGVVHTHPADELVQRALAMAGRTRTFDGEGRTRDGHAVDLLANVGSADDAQAAATAGAQGVGLFRTEFCFLDRDQPPTHDEQVTTYRRVLASFAGRKVVVRTLDAGADKPLPFLTADDEPNPALGVRGLRADAAHPEVLDGQLAAIAAAAAAETADVWVMAPMVSTVPEAQAFVARCAAHGLRTAGVMVEVPAAALRSRHVLAHAAFASIGTNDLTQYTMAADRMLAGVAALSSPWEPAVLDLVDLTCRGGRRHGRPVGVCGEAAADPALAVVLVGLGVASLSMSPRALADVGAVLREVDLAQCRRLAQVALDAPTADAARDAVRAALPVLDELGL